MSVMITLRIIKILLIKVVRRNNCFYDYINNEDRSFGEIFSKDI